MRTQDFIKKYGVRGLAGLLAVAMITGTVAYWTQTQQAVNEFKTGKYSTELVETFEPPSDWLPGQATNKDVTVQNDGTVPVFVRVEISQQWIRRENVYDAEGKVILPEKGDPFSNTFAGTNGEEYAALLQWSDDVVLLSSGQTTTPSLSLGLPTVSTVAQAKGKWLLTSETPNEDGKLVFYYIDVLEQDKTTPLLLDGVRMNPNIQGSTLSESTVWDADRQVWVTTTTQNPTHDYQNAHCTVTVAMSTVQATQAAVEELFGSDKASEQAVVSYLQTEAVVGKDVDYSRDDTVTEKKLYLAQTTGKLTYIPATPDENWFMSHLNMMPGETYTDTLQIENKSDKSHTVYLQVVPKNNQEQLPKELLELIHMKVYYGTTLIYDGTALGKDYAGSIRNLQNVMSLGKYNPNASATIRVELTLDKDTPLEYSDLLTQIDWKFMTEEEPEKTTPPKTGDESNTMRYIIFMSASAAGLMLVLLWERKQKKAGEAT